MKKSTRFLLGPVVSKGIDVVQAKRDQAKSDAEQGGPESVGETEIDGSAEDEEGDDVVVEEPSGASAAGPKGVRISGLYMGGHPQHPRKTMGVVTMHVTPYGVVVKGMKNQLINVKAQDITDIHVEADPSSAKRPAGAKLALGVFALATSKKVTDCYVIVNTVEGDVIMHVRKQAMALQGPLSPFAALWSRDEPSPATVVVAPPIDLAEQIRKLGDLRASGLLTSDEFETKKAELLARM